MSIQDDLQIVGNGNAWCIVGAVDMGVTNNMLSVLNNKGKKVELATHCLQFISHGLSGFRWPVAYYGSNQATMHQIFALCNFFSSELLLAILMYLIEVNVLCTKEHLKFNK